MLNKEKFYFLNRLFFYKKVGNLSCSAFLKKYFVGIGYSKAFLACAACGITGNKKLKCIDLQVLKKIEKFLLENVIFGRQINNKVKANLQNHIKLGTYRGMRLVQCLPMRGQRTHTNAQTAKKLLKKLLN